jgi:hypothetical protein
MRRFQLHALYAGTCAVLLLGCQSAVAPPSPAPAPPSGQSLSFEISGPHQIDASGPFSWEAFAFGGAEYQYRWEVTRQAGQQVTTSSERRLSFHVLDTDGDILLRLTVTSGNHTRAESFAVRNCIGGC